MQRKINVEEFEKAVNMEDNIEPMIVKRKNKKDLIVISLEQYQREIFLNRLEKSKKQYKENKVYSARTVFKELKEKYGY